MKRRLLWIVGIVVAAGVISGGYLYTQGIGARPIDVVHARIQA